MDVVCQVGTPAYMAPEICRDGINVAEVNAVHERWRLMYVLMMAILCKCASGTLADSLRIVHIVTCTRR